MFIKLRLSRPLKHEMLSRPIASSFQRILLLILVPGLLASSQNAQQLPKPEREFRAAWIATVDNIDFPTRKDLSPEKQKEELLACLELAKSLRLNAVIFQVRPM